ncbi:MAG: hypothetical protein L0154_14085 [Chloroflexi bacterium]|nr:hypothetical protein [Chloroflexota bacterium]
MNESIYQDVFGNEIVLANSVRAIILQKHPETQDFIDLLPGVLAELDEIRRSVYDGRVVLYYRFVASVCT